MSPSTTHGEAHEIRMDDDHRPDPSPPVPERVSNALDAIDSLIVTSDERTLDQVLGGLIQYLKARWNVVRAERVIRGEEPYRDVMEDTPPRA